LDRSDFAHAADRSIEHGDTLGPEVRGKTARGKRVDRAHAQDDVTLLGGLDNPVLAEDHGLGLIGSLDHADRAMAFGGNGFGFGFERWRRPRLVAPPWPG
jgi:hypothetical protein